ncbi:hypothetical protein SALBM311S_04085 [Streptomyces alboniger]
MARISRRRAFHSVNASVLAATLAFPAGLTSAVTALQDPSESRAQLSPADTPPPPPGDTPPAPDTPDPEYTPPPDNTPSGPATPPPPDSTPTPGDTPPSDPGETPPSDQPSQPPGSDDADPEAPDLPAEQTRQIEDVTTRLDATRDEVPEELVETVDELTTTLEAVESPHTPPQDRQEVIESIQHLTTALTATGDDSTPPKLQNQLIPLVKQASSALKTGYDPQVPSEARSFLLLVVKRTTSSLGMICDPETPQKLRDQLIATTEVVNHTVSEGVVNDTVSSGARSLAMGAHSGAETSGWFATQLSAAVQTAAAQPMPREERDALVGTAYEQSKQLKVLTDPRTSSKNRTETAQNMRNRSARLSNEQEEASSAQGQPKDPIGKSAEACTNAIFESTAERKLANGLKNLIPQSWTPEEVKDFWKTQEKGDELLEVIAQLQNDQRVRAPVKIAPLITALAKLVPRSDLLTAIGAPASGYCQATASYLDNDLGITVGSWLE